MAEYISRQKAIKAIMDLPNCPNGYSDTYDKACIIGMLEEVPTADVVERKKGKWVLIGSRLESRPYACSECNYAFQVDTVMGKTAWNFCPNCGARMDERKDDD